MISEKLLVKTHRVLSVVFAITSLILGFYEREDELLWTLVKILLLNVVVQVFYYAISLAPLTQLNWLGKGHVLYKNAIKGMRLFSVGAIVMGLFLFFTSIDGIVKVLDIETFVGIFLPCFITLGALSLNTSLQKLS